IDNVPKRPNHCSRDEVAGRPRENQQPRGYEGQLKEPMSKNIPNGTVVENDADDIRFLAPQGDIALEHFPSARLESGRGHFSGLGRAFDVSDVSLLVRESIFAEWNVPHVEIADRLAFFHL